MKKLLQYICLLFCSLATAGYAQNAPLSIAGTVVSLDSTAIVPVLAVDFNNISSCNLKLSYDPTVAVVTAVTIGQGMGGMISANLSIPGIVNFGWFTSGGINLPDSSVIFNIHFNRLTNGMSPVSWVDDGYSCEYNDGNFEPLNDVPASEYYINGSLVFQSPDAPVTCISHVAAVPGSTIDFPVTVSGFDMIGAFSLNLSYDPEVLSWLSFSGISGFPGLTVAENQPGLLVISGLVSPAGAVVSLGDADTLVLLEFDYSDGYCNLEWSENGNSCYYTGAQPVYPLLNDVPQSAYYINGSVSANALPAQAGAIAGPSDVCAGSTGISYSVPVIPYATGYLWSVPEGAIIASGQSTNSIQVDFGPEFLSGLVSVYGTNSFGAGPSSSLDVLVSWPPAAAGPVSGMQEVCQGENNVNFNVQPVSGASWYNWFLPPGANITEGAGTNSILVEFSTAAISGTVSVSGWNHCGEGAVSLPFPVIVKINPAILIQPVSPPAVAENAGVARFFIEAEGTGITYQWQEYVSSWSNLSESDTYVGVVSDTLAIVNPGISMDGFRYRCIVTGECEPPAFSDGDATLTVIPAVGMNQQELFTDGDVYPNPFHNQLNLRLIFPSEGDVSITLTDIQGRPKMIATASKVQPGPFVQTIQVEGLGQGIYFLGVKFKNDNDLMLQTMKVVCLHSSR